MKSDTKRSYLSYPKLFLSKLGPGLITGAADDDPSGIGTYSVAGAQFGYATLWTAWFSFVLMAAVQLMCARLGMVSGRGLGGLLRKRYAPWVLWGSCLLLVVANVVNIGADLGAMAAATSMVVHIPAIVFTPLYTALMIALMLWNSYRRIADVFKWMTLALFAYVIAGFLAHPDWGAAARATVIPHLKLSSAYVATFMAILGTTISPYLFFWQATQEVEEDRDKGKTTVQMRQGATVAEERDSRVDIMSGMLLSNVVMYFIILTTGATLHVHGQTHIATTDQAAEALRPLAGKFAYLLYTLGIVGTGMLSVPVLAGSTAYAIAEGAGWPNSLKFTPPRAIRFYLVLAASLALGMVLNYAGFGVVDMLFWAAVLNGVLAPPLIVLVVLISSDPAVMGEYASSRLLRTLGWFAAAVMSVAAVVLFATFKLP